MREINGFLTYRLREPLHGKFACAISSPFGKTLKPNKEVSIVQYKEGGNK